MATKLFAERSDVPAEPQLVAVGITMDHAKAIVDRMDSEGVWPEAFDAVFEDGAGQRWVLIDTWEKE